MKSARTAGRRAVRRHVVRVSGLPEARAAAAAAEAAEAALILVSEPGAASYLGAGYFAALIDAVRAAHPALAVEGALDCGADPGWALAALRCGIGIVILSRDVPAWPRVAAIARRTGARLLPAPPRPWPRSGPRSGPRSRPVRRSAGAVARQRRAD